jgi:hypothetical protein
MKQVMVPISEITFQFKEGRDSKLFVNIAMGLILDSRGTLGFVTAHTKDSFRVEIEDRQSIFDFMSEEFDDNGVTYKVVKHRIYRIPKVRPTRYNL